MTTIIVNKNRQNKVATVTMDGHAGDSRVCAGVSVLLYTLYNRLLELGKKPQMTDSDGQAVIKFRLSPSTEAVLDTCMTGWKVLGMMHPEHVDYCEK